MKTLYFILFFFAHHILCHAQTYYNFGFENWQNMGEYQNPQYWDTSNETFMIGTYVPVTKETTNPFYGNTSVKLKSTYVINTSVLAGVITLGNFEVNTFDQTAIVTGGKPYSGNPEKMTGFYKYSPSQNDRCGFIVELYKYNTTTKKRDVIADGILYSYGASDWTYFEVPINYYSTTTPDTFNIIILSSDTANIIAESTLWVDNIALQGGVESIEDVSPNTHLFTYYDRYEKKIITQLSNQLNKTGIIKLFDMKGTLITCNDFQPNSNHETDCKQFKPGIHLIHIIMEEKIYLKKIVID
jgi:hypothetical protein